MIRNVPPDGGQTDGKPRASGDDPALSWAP